MLVPKANVCSPLQVDIIILPVWYYDTSGVVGGRCDQRNPPVLFVVCRLLRHSLRVDRLAVVLLAKRVDALPEGKFYNPTVVFCSVCSTLQVEIIFSCVIMIQVGGRGEQRNPQALFACSATRCVLVFHVAQHVAHCE